MQRRLAPWFGALLLGLVGVFLAVFGQEALAPTTAVTLVGFVAAGLLSIAGGILESVTIGSRTVPWNVLVGAADVTVALVVVLSGVQSFRTGDAGTDAILVAGGMIVGGASLAWLGLQTARDTRHVDLEGTPSRRRVAALAALAIGSVGIGAVLAVV